MAPSSEYCTETSYEISPGVFTHSLTRQEVFDVHGCCQKFVCNIACPATLDTSGVAVQYGVPVAVVSLAWFLMAIIIARFTIKGDAHNFFVCKRTLPFYVVTCALVAQALDSNATLGNVLSAYKYGFWDGAVLPLGLGISLVLNGLLLAAPINRMGLLTLPELYGRKYGTLMEVVTSCITITSFVFLLAGNLVGISLVLRFCFGLPKGASLAISGAVLAVHSGSGGLFSVALTDVAKVIGGYTAFTITTIYMFTHDPAPYAPPVSLGFAYDLGNNVTARTPGYTGPVDCKNPLDGATTCDNYGYPAGDKLVYPGSMQSPDAYAPLPNALLTNWAALITLALGNLCAPDFQACSMASKSPRVAAVSNLVAGPLLIAVGAPFGLLAVMARKYFGPDSEYAEFEADTCSLPLGLPSCAQWLPDEKMALFKLLWAHAPKALGAWTMVAIATASMSTGDSAILATSTVLAHNVWRRVPRYGTKEENLLWVARVFHVPMTLISCFVAAWAYNPAYLLVVAFDIMLCGCLVPLLAAVYIPKSASPNAGLLSMLCGTTLRLVLEFALPKDGSLVAFGRYALHYGRALAGLPAFMEVEPPEAAAGAGVWDPSKDTCEQTPMSDWTGLDSLICPVFSLLVFVAVAAFERFKPGRDLLSFVPKSWRSTQPLYSFDADADSTKTPAGPAHPKGEDGLNDNEATPSGGSDSGGSNSTRVAAPKAAFSCAHADALAGTDGKVVGTLSPVTSQGISMDVPLAGTFSGQSLHHRDRAFSHREQPSPHQDRVASQV